MKINCQVNARIYTYTTLPNFCTKLLRIRFKLTHLWLANHTVRSANKPNYAQLPTTQTQLLQIISRTQDCLELDSTYNILVGAQLMLYSSVFQADCKLQKNY